MKIEFTEIQKENLLQWATWLEETTLPQGEDSLKKYIDKDTCMYCCLGIYVEHKYPEDFKKMKLSFGTIYDLDGNDEYLPSRIANEIGLLCNRNMDLQNCFARLNDVHKLSFKEIAQEVRNLVNYGSFTDRACDLLGV